MKVAELKDALEMLRELGVRSAQLEAETGALLAVEFFPSVASLDDFDTAGEVAGTQPTLNPDELPDGPYRRLLKKPSVS